MATAEGSDGGGGGAGAPPELRGFQKRALRGLAHALTPVAHVGAGGLGAGVFAAVDAALRDHELVKVRMHQPEDKKAQARALAEATSSTLCGLVGHTAILYRRHPERPRIVVPERPPGDPEGGA